MGTISPYETTAGKRYRVRYRTPDNRQTDRRGFRTKREAEAFAATLEVSKLTGQFVEVSRARAHIDELGREWLDQKVDVKPSTRTALESAWRVHVQPQWGTTAVSKIEHSAVKKWVADLSNGGKSATTVKRAFGVLSAILDDAVRARRILHNPCKDVKTPKKVSREHTYLSHAQLHSLAAEAGRHKTMILVMGYTGLRWGEVIGLRVRDADFARNRLTVSQNAVEVGSTIHVGTPKTHERRSVPVPAFLVDAVKAQSRDKLPDALLFPGPDGQHMRRTRTDGESGGWFAGAVRRAGVPRVTPHDLRHTAASLAISAGANVKAVQLMLGHKSAAMTLDTYSGLFEDDLDAVAAALHRIGASHMDLSS
jgi:integrase